MKAHAATAVALALCAWLAGPAQSAAAAADFRGSWTLAPADSSDSVRLGLIRRRDGGTLHHESDWPLNALRGLDLATRTRHEVKFSIVRDAGRFECEGYLDAAEGAGVFHFTPDAAYARDLAAAGFDGIDAERQFGLAIHDVTIEFARQMKNEKLAGLDTDTLLAMRAHGVTPEYIGHLRAHGVRDFTAEQLLALRIHGID